MSTSYHQGVGNLTDIELSLSIKSLHRTTKECVIRCRKARCIEGIKDISSYKEVLQSLGCFFNYDNVVVYWVSFFSFVRLISNNKSGKRSKPE